MLSYYNKACNVQVAQAEAGVGVARAEAGVGVARRAEVRGGYSYGGGGAAGISDSSSSGGVVTEAAWSYIGAVTGSMVIMFVMACTIRILIQQMRANRELLRQRQSGDPHQNYPCAIEDNPNGVYWIRSTKF
ncbi:uncharacterized protein LOC127846497 [Dreissena polymorpha]|uniref:uncharacterized protein LOC127846497 n=1 Tax=Dreissena polymorpha TaxID=45954 RepID=UPI002264EC46|nr:uncharacterized protein LOC127846497 [Dreissena polymorpha]